MTEAPPILTVPTGASPWRPDPDRSLDLVTLKGLVQAGWLLTGIFLAAGLVRTGLWAAGGASAGLMRTWMLVLLYGAFSLGFRQARPVVARVDQAGLLLLGIGLLRLSVGALEGEEPYHAAYLLLLAFNGVVFRRPGPFLAAQGAVLAVLAAAGAAAAQPPGIPFLVNLALALALGGFLHGLLRRLGARIRTLMRRTGTRLAHTQVRAGLLALRTQLESHTLFNALNSIAGLVRDSPLEAEEATRRLAALLRRIHTGLDQDRWTLREEFQVLEDLLQLQRFRFGRRLDYRLRLDASLALSLVPPLVILPLVENSLVHGFRRKVGACALRVTGGPGFSVRVEDDGTGLPPHWREGAGLRMARERLEAAGGGLVVVPAEEGCVFEARLG